MTNPTQGREEDEINRAHLLRIFIKIDELMTHIHPQSLAIKDNPYHVCVEAIIYVNSYIIYNFNEIADNRPHDLDIAAQLMAQIIKLLMAEIQFAKEIPANFGIEQDMVRYYFLQLIALSQGVL